MPTPREVSERLVKAEVTLDHVREDIKEIKDEVDSVSDQQVVQTSKLVGLETTLEILQRNVQEVLRVSKGTALDTDISKTLKLFSKEKFVLAIKYGGYIALGLSALYGYFSTHLGNIW